MRLEIQKFGTLLNSRPIGKEAFLVARAYNLPKNKTEPIEIDFTGVKVLTPSWADEFVTPILKEYPGQVTLLCTENASVKASLEIIGAL